jgi:hypothetical protein
MAATNLSVQRRHKLEAERLADEVARSAERERLARSAPDR